MAYKLELPRESLVHPIFHISLSKKKVGGDITTTIELPKVGLEGQFLAFPKNVLQTR